MQKNIEPVTRSVDLPPLVYSPPSHLPMICSVDRRLHNRAIADLDVEVIRIRTQEPSIAGRLEDISEAGVCLILPCELTPEELVRLEAADSTLFGHVIYSSWKRNAFRTGVELERVLLGGTDLADLLRSALQDTMPGVSLSR
jgi:hypothetical protein